MSDDDDDNLLFGLGLDEQKKLAEQLNASQQTANKGGGERPRSVVVPERYGLFKEMPDYKHLQIQRVIGEKMHILNPFFTCHDGKAKGRTHIGGREFINFSTYDYIGLNGHPEINAAAIKAMDEFGTSAGASRLVAGERPPHREFELALARQYGVDDAVIFVSGHATNVSTISTLLCHRDAVYYDALAHNSIIMGAKLSGATRYAYPHNDYEALERMLRQTRSKHERAIIATEGLFSMDGDIADLPKLVALKQEYTCFLMVDEAHALGVLGTSGRGSFEFFGVNPLDVDIWMGTLSKTLCGCGGYIAGCAELIELLKFTASGFVYSVGMPPPVAAASCKALELMQREPERTARLQEISQFFLAEANARGLNTGHAQGYAVIPIIVGNSIVTGVLAAAMFERGINVLPIIYPVVEEGMARLRFFLSSEHKKEDICFALDVLKEEMPKAASKGK